MEVVGCEITEDKKKRRWRTNETQGVLPIYDPNGVKHEKFLQKRQETILPLTKDLKNDCKHKHHKNVAVL